MDKLFKAGYRRKLKRLYSPLPHGRHVCTGCVGTNESNIQKNAETLILIYYKVLMYLTVF